MTTSSSSKRVSIPWLALCAATLQCVALALIVLLLVCPTPWESSSISLLTIQPAVTSTTTTTTTSWAALASAKTASATTSSTSGSASYSTGISNPSNSPRPASTTAPFNSATPAFTFAQRRENPPAAAAAPASEPIAAPDATPLSYEAMPSSGGLNATALNGTLITNVSNGGSTQAQSDILLRVGALGVCYRSPTGVETCSSARLASQWQYTALQRVLDDAFAVQSKMSNMTTAGTATLHDIMPRNLATFATVLLSVIGVLTCVVAAGVTYVVVLVHESKAKTSPSSPIKLLTIAPWPSLVRACHWLAGACAITLVIASAIQKYKLSNVKDAFNGVSPASLAAAGFRGNPSTSSAALLVVNLTADTSNGFGFAWIATAALLVSAWLQRVALRRRVTQSLLPSQRSDELAAAHDKVAQFSVVAHQANSSQLSLSQPPPSYGTDTKHLYRTPSSLTLDSLQQHHAALPALRQAHEGNVRINAKESPPFARYHQQQQAIARSGTSYHVYPPAPLSRFAQPMPLSSPNIDDASEYVHDDDGAQASSSHTVALRSTSPAPSYWTAPAPSTSDWAAASEKQRERHYMAELRRQRSALSDTH